MNKTQWVKLFSLLVALLLFVSVVAGCGAQKETKPDEVKEEEPSGTESEGADEEETPAEEPIEEVEVTFLHCWNGGAGGFPQDMVNNPVAQRIRERTGVTLKAEFITTSETEKLNTMFASGVMPDFVNAPYWSTTGGEGAVIKKAATEGMLLALNDYLESGKYPNIEKLYEIGVARDFKEFDLFHPDYEGNIYLIPQQTPGDNPEDVTNWAYGVYARGDILKELGVKPEEIDSSEKLYDLLVKIKNGNFTDINGKPVIPAGTWHNGWSYSEFLKSWSDYNISSYREEDGKIIHWIFSKDEEEKLMFMRKLIKEGLFDPEAFSNTDTMAKEKMAVGKIAVFGAQSGMGHFRQTLYQTNPEMKYELLGPFKNKSGNIATQVEKKGRSGFPVMFLSATTDKAEAVLRFINFCNSEEGWLLASWGIEGEHYTMENGRPKWIPEWKQKMDEDPTAARDAGIGYLGNFIGADSRKSLWPTPEEDKTIFDKWQDEYIAKVPIVFIDKVSANYLERDWPKYNEYRDAVSTLDYEQEFRKACFASTDEEALKILNDIREKYRQAGLEELTQWVAEKAAERDDVGW
ncbi:MAG: extracellular solute-binding protein [Clostridiales bacterium]|jgi:putative aldouronate transport system substrate-binding protein|nr:extracellular solute-binding protein [Clostridiales bacterium]